MLSLRRMDICPRGQKSGSKEIVRNPIDDDDGAAIKSAIGILKGAVVVRSVRGTD